MGLEDKHYLRLFHEKCGLNNLEQASFLDVDPKSYKRYLKEKPPKYVKIIFWYKLAYYTEQKIEILRNALLTFSPLLFQKQYYHKLKRYVDSKKSAPKPSKNQESARLLDIAKFEVD